MNKREEDLLTILINSDKYLDTNYITDYLKCSERSIRNYCNHLNDWLSTFSSAKIERQSNLGLRLTYKNNDKNIVNQKLRREIKKINSSLYKHIEILNMLLICNSSKVSLIDISQKLYVNKNTVREEIQILRESFKEYGLELSIKKNMGITVIGDEKNIRVMLVDYFYKYIYDFRLNIEEVENFHYIDVIVCKNIMNIIEEKLNIRFTDISFKQCTLFLIISIIRIRRGNSLIIEKEYENENIGNVLDEIEHEIKSNLAIIINDNEKQFIESLINSMNKEVRDSNMLPIENDIKKYTKNIINLVSEESGINFTEDNSLYENLLYHIYATSKQVKNNVNLENPLLESIKSKYYFLFNIIFSVIRNDNKYYISEDEIGYLTLHFQTSLEKKKKIRDDIKRASIVCPLSFGVSTLLKVKIEKKLSNIEIVETIREEDLKKGNFNKSIDFIITLRDYDDINIPRFITTPLFTQEDEIKLKDFILHVKKRNSSYSIMNKLMISDYFIKEVDFNDIYDCIKFLAQELVKKHYVDKEYIQSIIEREYACPTYIGNGILLPHGDIKYVRESILCIARLKSPIKLKNGDCVKIIIMLAYRNDDREEFQELFKEVSRLTEDNDMVNKIISCDINKIKNILI